MTEKEQQMWDALRAPFPPEAYKDLSFGNRKQTSIDAYHIIERLTEVFGLCGDGWGEEIKEFKIQGDNIACFGSLWWRIPVGGEEKKSVIAVGDATIFKGNIAEGMKKAQTNMISKAASFLGVGLDVYKGQHDSDPYLDRANNPAPASVPRQQQQSRQSVQHKQQGGGNTISDAQNKRLFAICASSGVVTKDENGKYDYTKLNEMCKKYGVKNTNFLTRDQYEAFCNEAQNFSVQPQVQEPDDDFFTDDNPPF